MSESNLQLEQQENGQERFDLERHARYSGRLDWQAEGPILSWAGSSIAVSFHGDAIIFRMNAVEREDTWFDVIVDGIVLRQQHIEPAGSSTIAVEGLGEGRHTVQLFKRTEGMFGTVQFTGCELPSGGQFLPPPPPLSRRIEVIGDSISCGSGNEGKDGDPNVAEHENCALAYGTVTARALQADVHITAVSGIGLVVNYGDERVNTMPDQFWRLNPLQSDSRWDFSWTPDAVVINLGTNDSGYAIEGQLFKSTYLSFAARLRSVYPEAYLVLSLGPFAQEPLRFYIEDVANQLREEGDQRIHFLLFDKMDRERDGMGETGHPNVITHARMADQLTQALKQIAGW